LTRSGKLGVRARLEFYLSKISRILPGPSVPSSDHKRAKILEIAKKFGCGTFVETGTFVGDTVAYMVPHFRSIISIELSPKLAERARHRFAAEPAVQILEGDSSEMLATIVPTLHERGFFWLDGHYSHTCTVNGEKLETARGAEETPVLKELAAVLADKRHDHVIVIDDARLFTGEGQYPTRRAISRLAGSYNRGYAIRREDDMIILEPPQASKGQA